MVKTVGFLLMALLAGALVAIQAGINGQLGQFLKHPILASLCSFAGGVSALVVVTTMIRPPFPDFGEIKQIPWYLFTGGFLGVIIVTTILTLVPKIGIANVLAATITGQFIISIILDHFGAFGVPVHPINWSRVIGIFCLLAGLIQIQK